MKANITTLLFVFLFISCTQNHQEPNTTKAGNNFPPPVIVAVKAPIITLLDSCPPPVTIQVGNPEEDPAGSMVLMDNFNTGNGLVFNSIIDGCRDSQGNLWFASYGYGVSRYNGYTFTSITAREGLVSNAVRDIIEDKDQHLWFGTLGGLSEYNGRFFKNYTVAQGLINNDINCVSQAANGLLWIGTSGGLSQFDGKKFTNYTMNDGIAGNFVSCTIQDKGGSFWIGTDQGLSHFDGKSFENYTVVEGLTNNIVNTILEDKLGNLWIGTNEGLSVLDINRHFQNNRVSSELSHQTILSIHIDNHENLWLGTKEGAFQLKKDGSIIKFNTNRGLAHNKVNHIIEDRTGGLWFCTDNGLSRFDPAGKFFTAYGKDQGLRDSKNSGVCEDKGSNIWIATNGTGLVRLDSASKKFAYYGASQGLPDTRVLCVLEDRSENLWVGTEKAGICEFDKTRKVLKNYSTSQGIPADHVRCILEDRAGLIWMATSRNGVCCLDRERRTMTCYSTDQGLTNNLARSITEDKSGNLWFSTLGGGISRLDKDHQYFTTYTTDQGLANNNAWSISEDKATNLWICTEGGVSRYDGTSFATYTSSNGLLSDIVNDMVVDNAGVLWFGTANGFSALKGYIRNKNRSTSKSAIESAEPSNTYSNAQLQSNDLNPLFEVFGNKSGYSGMGVNDNAMTITKDNVIWAGTGGTAGNNLIRFDVSDTQNNQASSAVFITDLKINNETIAWYDLEDPKSKHGEKNGLYNAGAVSVAPNLMEEGLAFGKILTKDERELMRNKFKDIRFDSIMPFNPLPANLVLPYRHNNMTVYFAAIETARPYLTRYQYLLEGYSKEWSPVTDQTSATFGNIHEGSYVFKVKAQSPDGIWTKPASYKFKVLPPWYRTWWAYISYFLVLATAIWVFIKWRIRILKKEKNLLEQKVDKRTQELKEEKEKVETTLSELKSTQAQLIHSEKMASLGELTAGIAHEIQNPLNFVNNFSDVNQELLGELNDEIEKGNYEDVKQIAKDVIANEEKINEHGKRADAIVKGMLQHSRSSMGVKEPTDINALTEEYLRLCYHGLRAKDKLFHATIKIELDKTIEMANIIPQDVGRVLLNIFTNAFQAVAEKKVTQENNYNPTVFVTTKKIALASDNMGIEISVSDNGKGIPHKIKDKIFQPFYTTKPTGQGTGLGLSLSYDIIKAHGGEIKVDTKEGDGATFTIILPIK